MIRAFTLANSLHGYEAEARVFYGLAKWGQFIATEGGSVLRWNNIAERAVQKGLSYPDVDVAAAGTSARVSTISP